MRYGHAVECNTAPPKHRANRMLCITYKLKATHTLMSRFVPILGISWWHCISVWTNAQHHTLAWYLALRKNMWYTFPVTLRGMYHDQILSTSKWPQCGTLAGPLWLILFTKSCNQYQPIQILVDGSGLYHFSYLTTNLNAYYIYAHNRLVSNNIY